MSEHTAQQEGLTMDTTPGADVSQEVRIVQHWAMPTVIIECGEVMLDIGEEKSCLLICAAGVDSPTPRLLAELRSLSTMLNHPDVQRILSEREENRR